MSLVSRFLIRFSRLNRNSVFVVVVVLNRYHLMDNRTYAACIGLVFICRQQCCGVQQCVHKHRMRYILRSKIVDVWRLWCIRNAYDVVRDDESDSFNARSGLGECTRPLRTGKLKQVLIRISCRLLFLWRTTLTHTHTAFTLVTTTRYNEVQSKTTLFSRVICVCSHFTTFGEKKKQKSNNGIWLWLCIRSFDIFFYFLLHYYDKRTPFKS